MERCSKRNWPDMITKFLYYRIVTVHLVAQHEHWLLGNQRTITAQNISEWGLEILNIMKPWRT
jgi:hypothetical protein